MLKYLQYFMGKRYEKAKNWKAAGAAYRKALTGGNGINLDLHYRLGFVLSKAKNWKEAEEPLRLAAEGRPQKAQWQYRLANALVHLKRWEDALAAYDAALALEATRAECHLRRGICLSKLGDPKAAEQAFFNALEYDSTNSIEEKIAANFKELINSLRKKKQWEKQLDILDSAIRLDGKRADWHMRRGTCLMNLKKWVEAEEAFRSAVERDNTIAEHYNKLAEALRKQGKWWQEVEALEAATKLEGRHAGWFNRLGEACEVMKRFAQAAEAYQQAVELKPGEAKWYYRLGHVLEQERNIAAAAKAYSEAIKRDATKASKRFGVGVFHQQRGLWKNAATAYALQLEKDPFNAELHYKLGMAYDRCYLWSEAGEAYQSALALDPAHPYWHYRLGFVLERIGAWNKAAQAYLVGATTRDKHSPYWFYRLGYVLDMAGRYEEACNAFARTRKQQTLDPIVPEPEVDPEEVPVVEEPASDSTEVFSAEYLERFVPRKIEVIKAALEKDASHADWYYRLGNELERAQDWEATAEAYSAAVARKEVHTPFWYYRLGFALATSGKYKEACVAFKETRILKKPYGVSEDVYSKNAGLKKVADYTEYFESLAVCEYVVLYESYGGVSMSCSPYAIFKHLLDHPDYQNFLHVWVIDDKARIPLGYRERQNVIFISKESDLYLRYLATAGYLINNSTFPPYFIRRPEQKYLNTWHGTPLKTLGIDIKYNPLQRANTARNFLHATHLLSPNAHTSYVMVDRYGISGTFEGKLAETGYPRIDQTLNATEANKLELYEKLGLSPEKSVVLYAPTYRGYWDDPEIETSRFVEDIKELAEESYSLVFRGHYFAEAKLASINIPVTIAPQEIDTCELLSVVDILITDYSSIFFDFLPTGKPIIHYAYDMDHYAESRGLYFDMHEMPGTLCRSMGELKSALNSDLSREHILNERYLKARQRFCLHEDGQATRRAVEFFFQDRCDSVVQRSADNRQSLLFYGSPFIPNGITNSCVNLFNQIDPKQYRVSMVIGRDSLINYPERLQKVQEVSESIGVIIRSGRMNLSIEEQWVVDKFSNQKTLQSSEMWEVYHKAFVREFKRVFGPSSFDVQVDFNGYRPFWASLIGIGGNGRKAIYLHNDMYHEWLVKFPYLEGTFKLYDKFNTLISVSMSVNESNIDKINKAFSIEKSKFRFCNNCIEFDEINELSEIDLDLNEFHLFNEAKGIKFITMGRLSPEKGHAKLIDAFYHIYRHNHEAKLFILGDGPLKHELITKVDALGLQDVVFLLGQQINPFPYLKRADCFVFSSDHEGQGLVLLEALSLGVPTISTDIPGPRSVLEGGYGLLVENSVAGLTEGMIQFLNGELSFKSFNSRQYQQEAIEMFYSNVCNNLPLVTQQQKAAV